MSNLRTKGKSTIVWILLGLLVLGLGGFGVTSFSGGSSQVGSVGETRITAEEYARALRQEMAAFQQQTGQPLTVAQAQTMGVTRSVQAQLFTAAALEEQARQIGVSVGDARVMQTISGAQAFRGPNGTFDRTAYAEALRREGMSEAQFEAAVRTDEARFLIQRAVTGGVVAPAPLVDQTVGWMLEDRDLSWRELTTDQLPSAVSEPDEATLQAWHEANADRFTAPEIRKISYVWLTPEMLAPAVDLDEAALREVYQAEQAKYQQPERRLVSRLVFPTIDEAQTAKAAIDAGQTPFETYVIQRGLGLDDVDLGEMTQAQLGDAGPAVFALEASGVVGPVQTDLGPALFTMNAILDPVDISFEDAQQELRSEAALDRATRLIEDRSAEYEDLLAGGATLEQVAEETEMTMGQIAWSADAAPDQASIAGYQSFRDLAGKLTQSDFPELMPLDDGGVFAVRLDEIVPPALRPLDEVRGEVLADWQRTESHRQLLELAEEERLTAASEPGSTDAKTAEGAAVEAPASPAWTTETGITRDGWIDGVPPLLITRGFAIAAPGDVEVVDAQDRVFLVRLDGATPADMTTEDAVRVRTAVSDRIGQSLQTDIFEYYARAAQRQGGVQINQQAIDAINAQAQ